MTATTRSSQMDRTTIAIDCNPHYYGTDVAESVACDAGELPLSPSANLRVKGVEYLNEG